jgi:hypothetical protein
MDDKWKQKYLKYKNKYLALKNQHGGRIVLGQIESQFNFVDNFTHLYGIGTDRKMDYVFHRPEYFYVSITPTENHANAILEFLWKILPWTTFNGFKMIPDTAVIKRTRSNEFIVECLDLLMVIEKLVNVQQTYTTPTLELMRLIHNIQHPTPDVLHALQNIVQIYGFYVTTPEVRLDKFPCTMHGPHQQCIVNIPSNGRPSTINIDMLRIQEVNHGGRYVPQYDGKVMITFIERSVVLGYHRIGLPLQQEIIDFARDMAYVVKYFHTNGFIHGSLTLENMFYIGGRYKVFSFCSMFRPTAIITEVRNNTPYSFGSIFQQEQSVLYDWWCIFINILRLLDIVDVTVDSNNNGILSFKYIGNPNYQGFVGDRVNDRSIRGIRKNYFTRVCATRRLPNGFVKVLLELYDSLYEEIQLHNISDNKQRENIGKYGRRIFALLSAL